MIDIINRKGYFFDLDGTLVDSSPCHSSAFSQVLSVYYPDICKNFDYERFKGKSTPSVFRELGIKNPEEVKLLTQKKRRSYLEDINNDRIPVFSGALELVRLLFSKSKKIYVVTSASEKAAHVMLKVAGFMPYINGVITSQDVKRNKPHPDIYRFALEKSRMNPEDVLVIEDSLSGKMAAQKAGIDIILVNQELMGNARSNSKTLKELHSYIKNAFERKKDREEVCAVIPAAGRGERLGKDIPKILVRITKGKTVWHILHKKLWPVVDQIHVILSRRGMSLFKQQMEKDHIWSRVSVSVQETPTGMGDAIFGAFDYWKDYENILVIWGDQVFVSAETIKETIRTQLSLKGDGLTIPINFVNQPYVQYVFNDAFSKLIEVKQTREGDICERSGFADVGVFCLSTSNLMDAWQNFLENSPKGAKTEEVNFLPFLPYLSTELDWKVKSVMVKDPTESRGINTIQDLTFFKTKFESLV